ncbi:MAG TPA: hypothetical protein VJA26_13430 [Gammaproteobacteria bacterium]|nr:hypothetical protein [Gammaproteobacteria bacterium]
MKTTILDACVVLGLLGAAAFVALPVRAEVFVDIGAHGTRVEADLANQSAAIDSTESGVHLGVGVRRALRARGDIGARLELDSVDSNLLLTVRALDYRYHVSEKLAVGAFFGAARLDLATPAYGYYLGGGVTFKELLPGWDLGVDLRLGDKVARDNLLPSDPQGARPDNFYDLSGISVYLSHRF